MNSSSTDNSSSRESREPVMEKLLVVEDDKYLREEILRVLERRTNYTVFSASDAEQALDIAESQQFDLLITDVRMPGIDGIELLERLKNNRPELASIIITAFADEQATIRALKIGANDYIRKPFSIRDLVNAIDRQITVLRLRNEAEQSRRLMTGLVHSVQAGVLAIDKEGLIAAANERVSQILDFDGDESIGKPLTGVLESAYNERSSEVLSLLKELEAKGVSVLERELSVRQAGLPISYLISATVISGGRNNRLGTVIMFDDVSELIQSQKLNAWKDLARTVAHEIKNPLTPIKLSAQQLISAKNAGPDTVMDQIDVALANIIKNADRLDSLAREFSRFGRLPQKEFEQLDLAPVLEEALESCIAKNVSVKIIKRFEGDLPQISGDHVSLLRMAENLINNAYEAMPSGGTLEISLEKGNEESILLKISDSGAGIEDEIRDSLFKPYVTSKEGGTGLGLVVVKEVVNRHGGTIQVHSEAGTGTTFEIQLPLHH